MRALENIEKPRVLVFNKNKYITKPTSMWITSKNFLSLQTFMYHRVTGDSIY